MKRMASDLGPFAGILAKTKGFEVGDARQA